MPDHLGSQLPPVAALSAAATATRRLRIGRLAARHAQIVGLLPQFDPHGRPMLAQATEAATERKVAILRDAASSGFERLELNVLVADAGIIGAEGQPLASIGAIAKSIGPRL